jgi:hypothetical protein
MFPTRELYLDLTTCRGPSTRWRSGSSSGIKAESAPDRGATFFFTIE